MLCHHFFFDDHVTNLCDNIYYKFWESCGKFPVVSVYVITQIVPRSYLISSQTFSRLHFPLIHGRYDEGTLIHAGIWLILLMMYSLSWQGLQDNRLLNYVKASQAWTLIITANASLPSHKVKMTPHICILWKYCVSITRSPSILTRSRRGIFGQICAFYAMHMV